jgi:hypothetical protein
MNVPWFGDGDLPLCVLMPYVDIHSEFIISHYSVVSGLIEPSRHP